MLSVRIFVLRVNSICLFAVHAYILQNYESGPNFKDVSWIFFPFVSHQPRMALMLQKYQNQESHALAPIMLGSPLRGSVETFSCAIFTALNYKTFEQQFCRSPKKICKSLPPPSPRSNSSLVTGQNVSSPSSSEK
jgi:hypothetical protein